MSAPRVLLSPLGTAGVACPCRCGDTVEVYLDELGMVSTRHLPVVEVADWPEYGAPAGYGALT